MAKPFILRTRLVGLVAALVTATCTVSWAVVSGIVLDPTPVILGTTYQLSADDANNQDPVLSHVWELIRIYPECTVPPVQVGNARAITRDAESPITYRYGLTTTYKKFSPAPPPGPTFYTRDVTVAPANTAKIVGGLKSPTPLWGSTTIVYHPLSGGVLCGPYITGMAQEKWTDVWSFTQGDRPDTDWSPAGGPTETFKLQTGKIYDEQGFWLSLEDWNSIPDGSFVRIGTQHLRIIFSDPCGNLMEMPLGYIYIGWRKLSDSEWWVEAETP